MIFKVPSNPRHSMICKFMKGDMPGLSPQQEKKKAQGSKSGWQMGPLRTHMSTEGTHICIHYFLMVHMNVAGCADSDDFSDMVFAFWPVTRALKIFWTCRSVNAENEKMMNRCLLSAFSTAFNNLLHFAISIFTYYNKSCLKSKNIWNPIQLFFSGTVTVILFSF